MGGEGGEKCLKKKYSAFFTIKGEEEEEAPSDQATPSLLSAARWRKHELALRLTDALASIAEEPLDHTDVVM